MQFPLLRSLRTHVVFLLASMILFTTGCEDDDHDHDEDHTDADGFILEDESGTEVYREFEGAMTGTVTLAVGETLELSVHFLDHEGNEIEHEEGEEEEEHDDELVVSENDASVAVVEVEDHEEGEEEHHEMALHVVGVSTGSTSFKLQLMHEGHADYTSTNNVPVTVN
jgi:activator of 2-hydroxyglutaryl-CoA dehydratase